MGNINGQWEHTWSFYRLNVNVHGHLQGERYSQTYGYAPKFQQWDLNTATPSICNPWFWNRA